MEIKSTITTLLRDGLILVFNQDKLDVVKTAQALIKAGVNNMEVTCRIKRPLEKLERLRRELPVFVAGSASLIDSPEMLDIYNRANPQDPLPSVGEVADAGACYLVSAGNFSDETFKKYAGRIPIIPGCGSVTEVITASFPKVRISVKCSLPNSSAARPLLKQSTRPFIKPSVSCPQAERKPATFRATLMQEFSYWAARSV
jgi:2-keto-3-deoxy-6-phosphogluconate aldolase